MLGSESFTYSSSVILSPSVSTICLHLAMSSLTVFLISAYLNYIIIDLPLSSNHACKVLYYASCFLDLMVLLFPLSLQGGYEKAGIFYMQSVKENNSPHEFILPYFGLGQVQLKLRDLKSALANFEKILEVHPENCDALKALGHIYIQLGQAEKAYEFIKKATKVDPRDPQACNPFQNRKDGKKDKEEEDEEWRHKDEDKELRNKEVPVELLNNIGVLHFERGEFELAEQSFKDTLGDGIWLKFLDAKAELVSGNQNDTDTNDQEQINANKKASNDDEISNPHPESRSDSLKSMQYPIDASASIYLYKDLNLFHRLEEQEITVELPSNKVSMLFNLARLLEQSHYMETASVFYRLILYKYPDYTDAYLRLAAIAKARNNVLISTEQISDAFKVDEKCPDALLKLGDLELKNNDWVKAKETFRAAKDMSNGNDSYASLYLGNWNYFTAISSEKRAPKLEVTHLEKAKELYTKI